MAFQVEIDTGDVEARALGAAERAARDEFNTLKLRFDDSLNPSVWDWPRATERGGSFRQDGTRTGGVIVFTPRNIIDTGELRGSLVVRPMGPFLAEYRWTVRYATYVHEGARLRNGTLLPARPWTDAVRGTRPRQGIPVYPLAERLGRRFARNLRRA